MEADVALWNWFCERRTAFQTVSAQMLRTEANCFGEKGGFALSRKWLVRFRWRHRVVLRKTQRRILLTEEDFAYCGLCAAEARIDIPGPLKDVGYLDPSQVKLRIPFDFVPPPVPQEAEGFVPKPKPKPKPKPVPRQLSITGFVMK